MSLFSSNKKTDKFGVIVDVGSGSALAAIVHSSEKETAPTVIWYAREHSPIKNIESTSEAAKSVNTSLMNAMLRLDSEGRKVLNTYREGAKITELQCTVSAPWSYTVTKNINYTQSEPFIVTKELIDDLEHSAQEKTLTELQGNEVLSELDLIIVAQSTMSLFANGYKTLLPVGEKAPDLSLVHGSVVAQQYLVDSIDDLQNKLFPSAERKIISFILMMYCVSKDLYPAMQETCLVDVTYEATEIGIVREGSLRYTTHESFGLFSIAREISEITKAPLYEAFKYLHGDSPYGFMKALPEKQKKEVELVFEAYIDRISKLLHETGDSLSIPKQMIVNTDTNSEVLMKDLLEKAAKRATKTEPAIHMVSKKLITKKDTVTDERTVDTALLLAARFFHKRTHCLSFKYT